MAGSRIRRHVSETAVTKKKERDREKTTNKKRVVRIDQQCARLNCMPFAWRKPQRGFFFCLLCKKCQEISKTLLRRKLSCQFLKTLRCQCVILQVCHVSHKFFRAFSSFSILDNALKMLIFQLCIPVILTHYSVYSPTPPPALSLYCLKTP